MDLFDDVFIDSIVIGVVCYAVSLSLAKLSAKNHKYEINANQELIAFGCANIFSSFFQSFLASGSLSRSAIQDKIGGKTQIAGLISCSVILIVLLFLGPTLHYLPKVSRFIYNYKDIVNNHTNIIYKNN